MRVMVSGGGTGGHIYPALAIAEALQKKYPGSSVVYVGNENGMEHELAEEAGYDFQPICVAGLTSKKPNKVLGVVLKNVRGVREAKRALKEFRPDLVIGTGGYACGPLLLAATNLGIPTLLHEQNAIMGKTNKILSRKVARICLTFPIPSLPADIAARAKITGLPVRKAILSADKAEGRQKLGLAADKPVLLLTGGSQGARHLNQAMVPLWQELLAKGVQIVHITGEKLFDETAAWAKECGLPVADIAHVSLAENPLQIPKAEDGFLLIPYLHHMEYALAAADVIVGRAGASFLAEVSALGRAAVLVPYPFAAGNHQVYNAKAFVDAGAALLIEDGELSQETLRAALQKTLFDIELREAMTASSAALGEREAAEKILAVAAEAIARMQK